MDMQVWIITAGWDSGRAQVISVYADRGLARDDFFGEAGVRRGTLTEYGDGSCYLDTGGDWLQLGVYDVTTQTDLAGQDGLQREPGGAVRREYPRLDGCACAVVLPGAHKPPCQWAN